VALIIVTAFAVWGAYCLAELLAQCLRRPSEMPRSPRLVAVLAADTLPEVWSGVLDVRTQWPTCPVIVVSDTDEAWQGIEQAMQGVLFTSPDTLGDAVCRQLLVRCTHKDAPQNQ
jgi:hypothetical protein